MSTRKQLTDPKLTPAEEDKLMRAFVTQQENDRLRARWENLLATDHQVIRPSAKPEPRRLSSRRIIYTILAIAASLLLVISVWVTLTPESGSELLATHQQNLMPENYRGGTSEEASAILRRDANNAYNDGNFTSAEAYGTALIDSGNATPTDQLNLGLAHLRATNYGDAERVFQEILTGAPLYRAEALYYLGLTQLSAGKVSAGKITLKELKPADGERLYELARELLDANWPE